MTPREFRSIRAGQGLTQRQLAQLLDVTTETVKAWEHGRNPIRHVVVLALERLVCVAGCPDPIAYTMADVTPCYRAREAK